MVSVVASARRLRPPWTTTRAALTGLAVVTGAATVWSWNRLGMSPTAVIDGIDDIRALLERMLPPRFVDTPRILDLVLQTFFMAYLGTWIASLLSLPLAFAAARNTTPHVLAGKAARAVVAFCRAVPDLVFALIFVRAVGIGPLAGILALSLHSIGMIGKLYADAIEQIDELPRQATESTGASRLQTLATAVLPQVLPSFVGTSLYRLDINLRTSVVLGFVGAGGIGFELQGALRQLVYDRGLGIVVIIAAVVIMVEFASAGVRRLIIGEDSFTRAGGRRRVRPAGPVEALTGRLRPPLTFDRGAKIASAAAAAILLLSAFRFVDFSPLELVTSLPEVWQVATRMFPPDFTTARDSMVEGLLETMAIGLVATVVGIVLTIPLGLLSARNVAPSRAVYYAARTMVVLIRSVPELILAIIFVAAIGLGPVPGVFALVVGTVGFMAKLMADGIEEIDPAPREAVVATGATRLQETATSVLPQALPSFVANSLYVLDVNMRVSAIVGIVGGGGIATLLNNSVRTLHYQTTSAIILSIFVIVYGLELVAGWIRKKII